MLIDLHVHSNYSEGFESTLADIAEKCRERGISGALLAECDTVPDPEEVARLSKELNFKFFIGVDIDGADGRLIAVPSDPSDERFRSQSWRGDDDDTSVRDVIDVMEAIDGAVIATHPYLDDGGPFLGDKIYKVEGLAAVEVICGVSEHLSNDLALEAAVAKGLGTVGGSDTGPEGQRLGRFATVFAQDISTQEELVEALNAGLCWAAEIKDPGERPRSQRRRRGGGGGGGGRGHGGGGGGRSNGNRR
ncbi:MAG: hypothetical protein ACI9KE_004879 [Polyangiales bacterium]|jgi:hypothetical protein